MSGYQQPPRAILDIVDQPDEPSISFSPDRTKVLQVYKPPPLPPISELCHAEVKLAGMRIDPATSSRSRLGYNLGLALVNTTDDLVVPAPKSQETPITGYPEGFWINLVSWSDDSKHIAFTIRSPGGVNDPPRRPLQLWVADAATGRSRALLPDHLLNVIFDDYVWVDDDTIVALVVPAGQRPAPEQPPFPVGPRTQETQEGVAAQGRTYPDLLQTHFDEDLFEHLVQSELVTVKVSTGEVSVIGASRGYTAVSPSPDGRFLLVAWLERPFSFAVPCGRFPKTVQLWTRDGQLVREVAHLPLAEDIPIAFNSCRKGPRGISWRDDRPAELTWTEAQDGGNPRVAASPRDIVYTMSAEVAGNGAEPQPFAETDLRCLGVAWGNEELALVYETWYKTRRSVIHTINPSRPEDGMQVLSDRNFEDAYSDPGSPVTRRTPQGSFVLAMVDDQKKLLMQGSGATPEGLRPFLDLLDVQTKETTRLWQSSPPYLESLASLLSDRDGQTIRLEGLSMLMSRETNQENPQVFIKSWPQGTQGPPTERQLSRFPHPHPTLKDLQKEVIRYKRADGVDLTATLYLPPGYDQAKDGPLPCLLWAYPREFKSKDAAGQMRKSPFSFSGIGPTSPLLWLAQRYAILDGFSVPIIAEGDEEPNDTYVEQLVAGAQAAVEEVQRRGVAEAGSIAVGGHSYGAYMVGNLMAHCPDLFACGIARSGAYNRTLTPFGFQAEERTLWEAADTYIRMSPYLQAHKIKKPILLIHGEDDNNTGTYPMQSERMFAALKGHGAPSKLVILPKESHGYRARESILHVLAESDAWMTKHLPAARRLVSKL